MGYVYCFCNDSMPGLLKIGMTERTPIERLSEANTSDTWRPPTPYIIVVSKKVIEPKEKEKKLHAILQEERVNPNREFFRVSTDKVFLLFDLMDGEYYKEPRNNYFDEFRKIYIRNEPNKQLRELDLLKAFDDWYRLFHGKKVPKNKDLFEYITNYYENETSVTKNGTLWYGLVLILAEPDDLI